MGDIFDMTSKWFIVYILGLLLTGAVVATMITSVVYEQKVSTLTYELDRANDSLEYYKSSPEEQLKIDLRKQEIWDKLDKALSR